MKINKSIIQQALKLYFPQVKLESWKHIKIGKENIILVIKVNNQKFILRFWGKKHGIIGKRKDSDIEYELELMNFFRENKIPVPKVYKSINKKLYEKIKLDNNTTNFALIDFVEGKIAKKFNKEMVENIAQNMAKIHLAIKNFHLSVKRNWPGTVIDITKERILSTKKIFTKSKLFSEDQINFFSNLSKEFIKNLKNYNLTKIPRGPIHGDIMIENIKFKNNKLVGIFDFDDCRNSYFIEDITKTILFNFESDIKSVFGKNGKNALFFLKTYQKLRKLSQAEKKSLTLFYQSRCLYTLGSYINKTYESKKDYRKNINQYIEKYNKYIDFFKLNQF